MRVNAPGYNPTPITVPCPTERRGDLLGDDLASALDEADRLAAERNAAHGAVARAADAIRDAERADAQALADAHRAGKPDPGPVNTTAARAALADAERLARGLDQARNDATADARAALDRHAADAVTGIAELADRADAMFRASLADAHAALGELRTLTVLARFCDRWPEPATVWASSAYDHQSVGRAVDTLGRMADALLANQTTDRRVSA